VTTPRPVPALAAQDIRPSRLAVRGGCLLLAEGLTPPTTLLVEDGVIAAVGPEGAVAARWLDASELIVAPGLVDIHGDAFERQLQPRPGVGFPIDLALLDTDRELLANGITTAFHAVTLSWEPGLRSEASFLAFERALTATRAWVAADHRLHLRLEKHAVDEWPAAQRAMERGAVHLLAINDHTPEIAQRAEDPAKAAKYAERTGLAAKDVLACARRALAREPEAREMVARACDVARSLGLPIASHDDGTPEVRAFWRSLGATICEFPRSRETAASAAAQGDTVVMGAPNVARGGSHLGLLAAEALVRDSLANVLASDYHYPTLRRAAACLAARGPSSLAASWALVSANAAAAAGLADRGRIAPGLRADLVLLDPSGPSGAEIIATLVHGRIVWLSPSGVPRLR
jgi:alpha-D-ribose 1-methylphosphonate 5-triphosphate diphosphatase